MRERAALDDESARRIQPRQRAHEGEHLEWQIISEHHIRVDGKDARAHVARRLCESCQIPHVENVHAHVWQIARRTLAIKAERLLVRRVGGLAVNVNADD